MPIPPFQNQRLHFLLSPLFRKLSQLSVQDQQNGKRAYCRLPPWYFRIILKDTLTHLTMESIVVCLSPQYLLNVFSNMYIPPWVRKKKFMDFELQKNTFGVKKLNLLFFTHAPKQNSPQGFHHHLSSRRNLPQAAFFQNLFFPQFSLKLFKVSIACFDKSDHIWTLHIFGFCFTEPSFRFKYARMWRFFNLTKKIFTVK